MDILWINHAINMWSMISTIGHEVWCKPGLPRRVSTLNHGPRLANTNHSHHHQHSHNKSRNTEYPIPTELKQQTLSIYLSTSTMEMDTFPNTKSTLTNDIITVPNATAVHVINSKAETPSICWILHFERKIAVKFCLRYPVKQCGVRILMNIPFIGTLGFGMVIWWPSWVSKCCARRKQNKCDEKDNENKRERDRENQSIPMTMNHDP